MDIQIKYLDKDKNLTLIEWINLMPKDIQRRLCITTWREFWKTYVPLTAKPPSWLKYKNYVDKTLWESRLNNIHFSNKLTKYNRIFFFMMNKRIYQIVHLCTTMFPRCRILHT